MVFLSVALLSLPAPPASRKEGAAQQKEPELWSPTKYRLGPCVLIYKIGIVICAAEDCFQDVMLELIRIIKRQFMYSVCYSYYYNTCLL